MAISHCWISERFNKRDELEPFLDLLKDATVRVALLVNFHLLESLLEFLDLLGHGARVGVLPSIRHVTLEDILAVVDVVPQGLHQTNFSLNFSDLVLRALNGSWLLKLLSVVPKNVGVGNEISDLNVDTPEGLECSFFSCAVAVEVALLHGGDILLEALLVSSDLHAILLALTIDKRSDLLLDVLGELFEGIPLIEELLCLLDLLVLADIVDLEELESFVKLVKIEHRLVVLFVDNFHAGLDSNEGLYVRKIFLLGNAAGCGLFHETLHHLDLLLNVLHHSGTGQMVDVCRGSRVEAGSVR